jgi:D-cysteine desulfhydrase family pyridoxal phosphate-dependent enzyme
LGGSARSPKILIKRDDLAGPALGGNKSRKLEYVVADALAKHATHLITVGGVQSNHARMTAAAARLAELSCVLVLTAKDAGPAPSPQGNLLLDELLDAEVHFVPPGPEALGANPHEDKCIAEIVARLESQGKRPYTVALGASVPLGVLGYVDAMGELLTQIKELGERPSRLYYGAGSRGTQAGIVLGTILHGAPWTPHGVAVSPGDPDKTTRALELMTGAAALIGKSIKIDRSQVITHQEFYGEGYAIPTKEADDAIRLLARTEAVLLDPVYTGKAMSGLIDHIRRGIIPPTESVVFLHTGGVPAVFAQAERLGASAA